MSGMPSRPPPFNAENGRYCPCANASDPMSRPPETCWHCPAAVIPAWAHVCGMTLAIRGVIPGELKIVEAILPGRPAGDDRLSELWSLDPTIESIVAVSSQALIGKKEKCFVLFAFVRRTSLAKSRKIDRAADASAKLAIKLFVSHRWR